MTELMKMIATKRMYFVVGIATHREAGVHVDNGRFYAALDEEDAVLEAKKFWCEEMGYTHFNGHARLIDRVGEYRVLLVEDSVSIP